MSRLEIRHKLRSQGSQVTMEDTQILESKRGRLQKLIDVFEPQADSFLLNHRSKDDIWMSSMNNYAEYDYVDDLDDSGDPIGTPNLHHSPETSDSSGMDGHCAEEISLLLPSTLGWEWCSSHGVESLANKEAKLRYAQATDALHKIRLALGLKSALFRTQVRGARTQKTKTRAWTAIHGVDMTVQEHARNYSMSRDAYLKVRGPSKEFLELPRLQLTDLRINTAILGAAQVGQRNKQLPWIWGFGSSESQVGTWMDECKWPRMSEHSEYAHMM